MVNRFSTFIRKIGLCLILATLLLSINTLPVWAHRPHAVVTQLELSSKYDQDQTLFIVVRNNLFKSTNGGEKFTRVFKGLDNRYDFGSLAISPQDPNHLFVSASEDGIYRSEDGGNSWVNVNNGLVDYKVDLIKISPHSDTVTLAAGFNLGLYRTLDKGNNWSQVIDDKKITAIAFSPQNRSQVFIADDVGNLLVSKDDGKTWENISSLENQGLITSIALSPNNDKVILVGTENGGVFKSVDQGISFKAINNGITDKRIRDIVVVSNSKQDLELFVSTWSEAILRSTDGGENWTHFDNGLKKDVQADEFKLPHFSGIKTSNAFNQDQTIFIAGFNGLFKSKNGGKNWQKLETLARGAVTSLAISPNYQNDGSLAVATYVGNIYTSRDKGKTWQSFDKGLEIPRFTGTFEPPYQDPRRFFDIAYSPDYKSDKTIFASILWTDILKSIDRGESWIQIALPGFGGKPTRGLTLLPSPNFAKDQTFFVGTQYGVIYRSIDQGRTFSAIANLTFETSNIPVSLVISPNFVEDKTLYAAGSNGVYRSRDEGLNWQNIVKDSPLNLRSSIQLAISPNYQTDHTLLAGTNRGLFVTHDGGESWSEIQSSTFGESVLVEGVAISPDFKNDKTIILSTRGRGLFKSVDGGKVFTKIGNDLIQLANMNTVPSAGIPIHFSPAYAIDKTLYGYGSVSTEVFKSVDGGATWEVITVPQIIHDGYDILTYLSLWVRFNYHRLLVVILAVTAAILAYFLVGNLNLHKRLPLSKLQIRAIAAFFVFIIALIIFAKLFHVSLSISSPQGDIVNDRS